MSNFKVPESVILKAREVFSPAGQRVKVCEELAELIQAISKFTIHPCSDNKRKIIEEMADVRNMMDQLQHDLGIHDDEIDIVREEKIRRLEQLHLRLAGPKQVSDFNLFCQAVMDGTITG
ncbi:hypothetical protein [Leptospira andrefontaineae]|uniref:Uncharacterized protein n=1 Tax=Leptospira andrefontaineae TaxID=2484976 RepID=A0A4R9GYQ6_9LEPT|nr:hypothetical protein [Leptospira andrefontaineae]TGK36240.1 hypothetical protein EHO65_18220 [Leptospira andrefontaineae]